MKKRQTALAAEQASVLIVNQTKDPFIAEKLRKLLIDKLGFKDVRTQKMKTFETRMQTVVFDNSESKKLFSLDELLKKIPASLPASDTIPTQIEKAKTDFTILVGEDILPHYNYAEDSLEDYNNAQEDSNLINLTDIQS